MVLLKPDLEVITKFMSCITNLYNLHVSKINIIKPYIYNEVTPIALVHGSSYIQWCFLISMY